MKKLTKEDTRFFYRKAPCHVSKPKKQMLLGIVTPPEKSHQSCQTYWMKRDSGVTDVIHSFQLFIFFFLPS